MKRLILLFLIGATGFGANHTQIERWPNGAVKSKIPTIDGVEDGVAKYFYENGQKIAAIRMKNGKMNGAFKLFREDGTLDQINVYRNGESKLTCWFDAREKLYHPKNNSRCEKLAHSLR